MGKTYFGDFRLRSFAAPTAVLLVVVSAILTSTNNVFNVYILKFLIDALMSSNNRQFYYVLFSMLLVSLAVNVINALVSHYVAPQLKNSLDQGIQQDIFQQSLSYSLEAYDNEEFYDLYYFTLHNSRAAMVNMVNSLGTLVSTCLSVVGIASIIVHYDTWCLLIIAAGVASSSYFLFKTQDARHNFNLHSVTPIRKINYVDRVFYLVDYSKELRTYKNSDLLFSYYRESWAHLLSIVKMWGKRLVTLDFSNKTSLTLSHLATLLYFGVNALAGHLEMSSFMMLFNGAQQIGAQLNSIIGIFPVWHSFCRTLEKYYEFMKKEDSCRKNGIMINRIQTVSFEHVSFAYDDRRTILRDVSLNMGGNIKRVAIVGRNGSGKSTLVKLLLGFYPVNKGRIRINGIDISNIDIDSFRERISVIYQDFQLFSFMIAQNVMMKYTISKEDEMATLKALELVGLYDKVIRLPKGIHSTISKEFDADGIVFSRGELQKLALARAYARNGDMIIMDEPYSSYDPISQEDVMTALRNVSRNKILIIISHGLVNLHEMDLIAVIDAGRLVELETHRELIRNRGEYSNM